MLLDFATAQNKSEDIILNYKIKDSSSRSAYYDTYKLIFSKNHYVKQILFCKKRIFDGNDSFLVVFSKNYTLYVQSDNNSTPIAYYASIPFMKMKDSLFYENYRQQIPFLDMKGKIKFEGEKDYETIFTKKRRVEVYSIYSMEGSTEVKTQIFLDVFFKLPLFVKIETFLYWDKGSKKNSSTIFEITSIENESK